MVNRSNGNPEMLIDVTVVKPDSYDRNAVGSAALKAIKNKRTKYASFNIPDSINKFKVFAMELTGYLSKDSYDVLLYIARRCADESSPKGTFSNTMKFVSQRVSVALQKGNAAIIRAYLQYCF